MSSRETLSTSNSLVASNQEKRCAVKTSFRIILAVTIMLTSFDTKGVLGDDANIDTIRESVSWTKLMLDDMYTFFDEGDFIPETEYQNILTCFAKWDDPILEAAQNASWYKFVDYYQSDGSGSDTWFSRPSVYLEREADRASLFGDDPDPQYLIIEPCNYVSNFAYYRAMLSVCLYDEDKKSGGFDMALEVKRAFKQGLAHLAVGSAWWHGSNTRVGLALDNNSIAVHFANVYLAISESLSTEDRIIKTLLKDVDRPELSELNHEISQALLTREAHEWRPYFETLPIRLVYEESILAALSLICSMTCKLKFCRFLMGSVLAPAFDDNDNQLTRFINDEYFPALEKVVVEEGFPVPLSKGMPIWSRTTTVVSSFLWALLWNEEVIVPSGISRWIVWIGRRFAKSIDFFNSVTTGYSSPDAALNSRKNVFPGSHECNSKSPHALWHQESADVLYETVRLVDDVRTLLLEHQKRRGKGRREMREGESSRLRGSI